MRRARNRRILAIVVGVLVVAIVGFVAVGLLVEDSLPGQVLRGTGVERREGDPTIFPSDEIEPSMSVAQNSITSGGLSDTEVTLEGLWGGYCKAYGTAPAFPNGAKLIAGTFKMWIEGVVYQGYCIDFDHHISSGDVYQANVHAGAEPGLCEAHWILANYNRDNPGAGLTNAEEGVAIQAALWFYVENFQPVWNRYQWCGKQAVYDRTLEIIAAAQGQCVPIPSNLDLSSATTDLPAGETADLTAAVTDQKNQPYEGQAVDFDATLGSLGAPSGSTNPQGQVPNTLTSNDVGDADVMAQMSGSIETAVVDPISEPKQRTMVVKPITYIGEDTLSVTWESPTAVELVRFEAKASDAAILVEWETATEIDSLGFNVLRSDAADGTYVPVSGDLIPSQAPGSPVGAVYSWLDETVAPGLTYFYKLEEIDTSGQASQYGPVSAAIAAAAPEPGEIRAVIFLPLVQK